MKMKFAVLALGLFLLKLAALAQIPTWHWAHSATPNQGSVSQVGIGTDALGNSYVTGFGYTAAGMVFGNTTLPPIGMFLAKYNAKGNLVWAKHISNDCTPRAIYTDK